MEGLEGFLKASFDPTFAKEKICYNDSCRGDDNFAVCFVAGGKGGGVYRERKSLQRLHLNSCRLLFG